MGLKSVLLTLLMLMVLMQTTEAQTSSKKSKKSTRKSSKTTKRSSKAKKVKVVKKKPPPPPPITPREWNIQKLIQLYTSCKNEISLYFDNREIERQRKDKVKVGLNQVPEILRKTAMGIKMSTDLKSRIEKMLYEQVKIQEKNEIIRRAEDERLRKEAERKKKEEERKMAEAKQRAAERLDSRPYESLTLAQREMRGKKRVALQKRLDLEEERRRKREEYENMARPEDAEKFDNLITVDIIADVLQQI